MTNLAQEQKQTIEAEIRPLVSRDLTVKTNDDRVLLVADIKRAEDLKKRIEEKFHPTANKVAAYEAYQNALDTEKAFYEPIEAFVKSAKLSVKTFDTNEALRVQREQEAAEARRREQERIEQEKLLERAVKADESGKTEIAEALLNRAETVQAPLTFTAAPQSVKKLVWKARVLNMQKLARAVADGLVPFSVLEVRQSALNDYAKGHDGKSKVDGLEFYQESAGRI